MKQLPILFLLMLLAAPAFGQAQPLEAVRLAEPGAEAADEPQVLHVTDALMQAPEGRAVLEAFRTAKAAGWLPPVSKQTAAVGDTANFKVVNIAETKFETHPFKLVAEGERFLLWVELAELDNGNVTQSVIDDVVESLATSTPAGSINPQAGVIVNDEEIFGDPPNIDGDGKSDVLLVDVRDSFNPDTGNITFVAGFVSPNDLPGGGGNEADVLYLDTNPSIELFGTEFVAQTAAHEYQHLIQLNYDPLEILFVNEGLSEWAEIINGYPGRRLSYLDEEESYNVKLFRFDALNASNQLDDRERGFRLINYFADRFGIDMAGSITRQGQAGAAGLQAAFTAFDPSLTLDDVVADFHLANLLNDTAIDARFGFTTPHHQNIVAALPNTFDGRFDLETPGSATQILAGGVQYFEWNNVEDLSVTFDGGAGSAPIRLVALTFQDDVFDERPIDFGTTNFGGLFDRVVVAAIHTDPNADIRGDVTYSASWNIENLFRREETVYDTGVVNSNGNTLDAYSLCTPTSNPELCQSVRMANRYVRPPGGVLTSVEVAPYLSSDFSNTGVPSGSPRDFTLKIWANDGVPLRVVTADNDTVTVGFRPGTELFSLAVADGRAASGPGGNLNFHEIDLKDFQAEMVALPDTVYIGLSNAGTDINFLVMGVTPFETGFSGNTNPNDALSYLYRCDFGNDTSVCDNTSGVWAAFHELTVNGNPILEERVLPFRAAYLVPLGPVSNDDEPEVPTTIRLAQNYPNPFNPSTTISYALPQAGPVRLAVYDLLGREVAVLVEGTQGAGNYQVQLDAAAWASGLYLYTLEAAGQRQSRRMLLIK